MRRHTLADLSGRVAAGGALLLLGVEGTTAYIVSQVSLQVFMVQHRVSNSTPSNRLAVLLSSRSLVHRVWLSERRRRASGKGEGPQVGRGFHVRLRRGEELD